jgi:hypothetical protein
VASTRLGPHAARHAWRFRLTGTNALPTPRLTLAPLHAGGLHRGERPETRATVRNTGTGPGAARVRLSIARLGSGLPLETRLVAGRIDAGAERDLSARFGSAPEGDYQVSAELVVGRRVVETRRLNVEVTARAGVVDRLRDWLSAHLLTGLIALALAGAALGVAVVLRRRPSAPPAPAPVPRDELADLRAAVARLEARADHHEERDSA